MFINEIKTSLNNLYYNINTWYKSSTGKILEIGKLPEIVSQEMGLETLYDFSSMNKSNLENNFNLLPYWGTRFHNDFWDETKDNNIYYDEDTIDLNSEGLTLKLQQKERMHFYGSKVKKSLYDAPFLNSKKCDFGYGYYEILAKFPCSNGISPAFWFTHKDIWPPEIDVVEIWMVNNPNIIKHTLHYSCCGEQHKQTKGLLRNGKRYIPQRIYCNNYMYYGVLWMPDKITFYINRHIVGEVTHCVNDIFPDMRLILSINIDDKFPKDKVLLSGEYIVKKMKYYRYENL